MMDGSDKWTFCTIAAGIFAFFAMIGAMVWSDHILKKNCINAGMQVIDSSCVQKVTQ
jgi:hypothetical protein